MACQALLFWMAQHNRLAFHCAVAAAALAAGCDSVSTKKEQTGSSTSVSVQFNQAEFERERDEYRRAAEARINEFETQLAELNRQARAATGEAKERFEKEVDAQQVNLEKAKQELKEIDAVVGERWTEFKQRSSKALDELGAGMRRAVDEFRK